MQTKTVFDAILKLAGLVPAVREQVDRARGKPSKAERERLVCYVAYLDERRVFFRQYNSEVVEACVGAIDAVKDYTNKALAELKHPQARAALGVILDATRSPTASASSSRALVTAGHRRAPFIAQPAAASGRCRCRSPPG